MTVCCGCVIADNWQSLNDCFFKVNQSFNGNRCLSFLGRVGPKRTQDCLPKSCHSLNLGMENFASILNGRFWPLSTLAGEMSQGQLWRNNEILEFSSWAITSNETLGSFQFYFVCSFVQLRLYRITTSDFSLVGWTIFGGIT